MNAAQLTEVTTMESRSKAHIQLEKALQASVLAKRIMRITELVYTGNMTREAGIEEIERELMK